MKLITQYRKSRNWFNTQNVFIQIMILIGLMSIGYIHIFLLFFLIFFCGFMMYEHYEEIQK